MRPSAATIFVALAIAAATGAGVFARSASGAAEESDVPKDAENVGFLVRGRANEVALLEATRSFRLGLAHGPVHGEPPSASHLAATRAIVTRELARYPASFLKTIRLRGVVFTEDLGEGDKEIPSLPNVGGLLLLDVASKEADLVRTFHHEVFHFFDLADDTRVSPDPAWDALNEKGFTYGAGGRSLRTSWAAHTGDMPGFVSGYATSGVEEDKAETFAFMMARPEVLRTRAPSDPVLARKQAEIARRIGGFGGTTPNAIGSLDAAAPSRLGL